MTHENTEQSTDATRQHLDNAVACLRLVGLEHTAPEYAAALALQELFMAAVGGADLAAISPETADDARRLMFAACPIVDASINGKIPSERLYFFLGVVSGLLTPGPDPFRADRLDYSSLIAAELRLIFHKRNLKARGSPLLRDLRVRSAWARPRGETNES
ncbi:hypothetical protein [Mesorhizobium sp. INR15]|uniref:hypothetical protein n=1 Tax=Mesorhizobium sp. INR15 TaxID=2654248 RepID=UPI0018967E8F|nr:hypothetical protein [Mesorhizobium sp. INR15]QPC90014.1 hypothetical protein GA829_05085 [Mesorhizobium sp. INR15]